MRCGTWSQARRSRTSRRIGVRRPKPRKSPNEGCHGAASRARLAAWKCRVLSPQATHQTHASQPCAVRLVRHGDVSHAVSIDMGRRITVGRDTPYMALRRAGCVSCRVIPVQACQELRLGPAWKCRVLSPEATHQTCVATVCCAIGASRRSEPKGVSRGGWSRVAQTLDVSGWRSHRRQLVNGPDVLTRGFARVARSRHGDSCGLALGVAGIPSELAARASPLGAPLRSDPSHPSFGSSVTHRLMQVSASNVVRWCVACGDGTLPCATTTTRHLSPRRGSHPRAHARGSPAGDILMTRGRCHLELRKLPRLFSMDARHGPSHLSLRVRA
ncbi:hypothetical protein Mal4_07840 [Maioricimonas rarisocia]|uniref:Uncharacterized protein n=1 Tax=Maioricimonas rarisocia TaxID=2528026 RepID=A0A517Z214_9PLAN|nr:hypothetical protein Mal4_07840 [Maioricimonas rarisocia]